MIKSGITEYIKMILLLLIPNALYILLDFLWR